MSIKFNLRSLLGGALAFAFLPVNTVVHAAPGPVSADVLVVIDESGSMSGEQRWIAEVVPQLDQNLQAFGVGSESQENHYGLIGFGDSRVVPRSLLLGGELLGNPAEFVQAANGLRVNGGTEDGWRGIEFALDTYPRRSGAVVNIILATDEDRDNTNSSITFNTVQAKLQANRALLNAVVNATIRCADNTSALGMDSTGVGYVADGSGGFTTCTGARAVSGSGTTVANYVNLAVQNGGAVWNLNFLRSGGHYARSFTNALLSIKVEEILNQRPVNDLNAVAQAIPNPAAVAQTITLDGRRSFHQLEGQSIVSWEWDLDNDGIYDVAGPVVTTSFPAEGRYPVRLRVTDDSATPLIDVAELAIDVSSSPLKPTAVAGGPYLFCPQDARWWLDGRGSVNPDDGQGSVGADTDRMTEYTWDLNNDLVFDDVTGALVDAASPLQALGVGDHLVRLRVTDNSLAAFPGLVQSNLSDVSITQVSIRDESDLLCNCLPDLAARPKNTKIQLTWTDNAAYEYVVYRSLQSGGPYEQIAVTESRYSTYLDLGLQLDTPYYYVVAGRGQDGVETCRSREITATPTARRLNASNRAPTFTSTPVTAAIEGTLYSYDVNATDPDTRDVITYSLAVAPTGMTIDGNTGLIQWTPINAQVGQHAVTVQASDVQGAFTNQSFVITVANVNQAPMIISQPVVSAAEAVAYRYAVQAIDADVGDALSYSLLTAPAGMTINSLTGEISWTPAPGQAGAHTVELEVTDAGGGQAQQSFVVQVEAQNLAPSIVSVPVVEAVVGVNYQYAVVATDPNAGDILTFALGAFPDGMTIDTATGIINWVPAVDQLGVHEITVVVSDDRNASSAQAFQLTVSEPNLAPVFTTTSLPDAIENVGYVAAVAAADPNAGDQVVYSLVSGPAGLVIDAQTGQINWLPRDNQAGANEVHFRATDNDGLFSDITLSIQVQAVNDAPVIVSLAPGDAQSQSLYRYQLLVEDPDAGDTLTYALVQAPAGMMVSATGLIEWTPPSNADATYPVQVTVTDAAGLSDSQSFTLSVINRDPVIISIPLTGVPERQLYTYQVIAQDDDGDNLTYAVQNAPGALSINAASGLLQWQTQAGDEGSYPVIIIASDNRGGSATQNITITIDPPLNAAPVIISAPVLEATEDAVYTYQVQAQDSDQDALAFTLTGAPQGMSMSSGGLISWTPVTAQIGNNDVTVQVSDGRAQTTQSFTIAVNAKPNLAPQITSAPATSAQVAAQYQYQILATDPESDVLTYGLMSAPAGMTMSAAGLVSWTPAEAQLGAHGVTVRVTDAAGNYTEQSFSITVIEQPNATPVITSSPALSIVAGALYQYALVASDADGDALQYSLIQGPSAASINSAGVLVWQTAESDVGSHPLVLRATDTRGAYAEQSFTLVVSAPINLPPVISSVPVIQAVVGQLYEYTIVADDPENAPLTLTLLQAPSGMSMTAFGDISWTPTALQLGTHLVQVQVTDGRNMVSQAFNVAVSDLADLNVSIQMSQQVVAPGVMATIQIVAPDAIDPQYTLTAEGSPLVVDANGIAQFSSSTSGIYQLEAQVQGSDGATGSALAVIRVSIAGDTTAPVVNIAAPAEGVLVYDDTAIIGTVTDANLYRYRLLIADAGSTNYREFASGTVSVTNDNLGDLDPSMLKNGLYNVLLVAEDINGLQSQDSVTVQVEGELKPGVVQLSFVDMTVPVAGIPITIERTYDSRVKSARDLGVGWNLSIRQGEYKNNREPGKGWGVASSGGFLRTPCYTAVEQASHVTDIRLSETESYQFRPRIQLSGYGSVISGGCLGQAEFVQIRGIPGATLQVIGNPNVFYLNGSDVFTYDLGDDHFGEPWVPGNVRLTTPDGRVFDLDLVSGITRMQDRNNNQLFISGSGVVNSQGQGVSFQRDGQGRIEVVRNALGNEVRYGYDAIGNLISFANQLGEVTTYQYHPAPFAHHLRSITLPDGRVVSEFSYDAEGRLSEACDEEGCARAEYDLDGRTQTNYDATGRATTYVYDARGNVLSKSNALGHTTHYSYDTNDRLIQVVDPAGNITARQWDANGNLLSVTEPYAADENPDLVRTSFSYDARGNLLTITGPSGAQLTNAYDAAGNLLSTTTETGFVLSQFGYDGSGRQIAETDPFGTIHYGYKANGLLNSLTDDAGVTTTFTHDAVGNLTGYNRNGLTADLAYDPMGRPTTYNYSDGLSFAYTYNQLNDWGTAEGTTIPRVERSLTAKGLPAMTRQADGGEYRWQYDAAGRVTAEVDPLGNATTYSYDAAGRLVNQTDALGNSTAYILDAAGRLTTLVDAEGASTTYSYYGNGRRSSMVDPTGRQWRYEYTPTSATTLDGLGRSVTAHTNAQGLVTRLVNADGSERTWSYLVPSEALGGSDLPTRFTDEGGRVRYYGYDSYGRLLSATDLAGESATYVWGPNGLEAVSDAEGVGFTLAYNASGRVANLSFSDGSGKALSYDGRRNLSSVTLASGISKTLAYDLMGRVVSDTRSTGEQFEFSWDLAGRLLTASDSLGTARYSYNPVGSITRFESSAGGSIAYSHDSVGRVSNQIIRNASGNQQRDSAYEYDGAGRLSRIVDVNGGETFMSYDAAGRLISRTLPNGITTTFSYDLRDFVTAVEHSRSGVVISAAYYERNVNGEPVRINWQDGSYVLLAYDVAGRIIDEQHHDDGSSLTRRVQYEYDRAGNRTAKIVDGARTNYAYGAGHRLLNTSGAESQTYDYDVDGRITAIARPGLTANLSYNFAGQIASAAVAGTTVDYRYDAAGRRIQASRDGVVQGYLRSEAVTGRYENPQAVLDADGNLIQFYTYAGDTPLMRTDGMASRYYLTDAQGSVIAITDEAGNLVGSVKYDAYGMELENSGEMAAPVGLGGDFRFHGQWKDAVTGLYNLRARDYDPVTGRFLSADPAEPDYREPESLNRYLFANANPYLFSDPSGRFTLISVNISLNIQATLRSIAVNIAKDYLIDKARSVMGSLVLGALKNFTALESFNPFGLAGVGTTAEAGRMWEQKIQNFICSMVPDTFREIVWFEPAVSGGYASANGYGCPGGGGTFAGAGSAKPDFILSKTEPVKLGRPPKTSIKAYLIGESKWRLKTFYNDYVLNRGGKRNQLRQIARFAADRVYARTAVFLALKDGTTAAEKAELSALLVREGVDEGAIPIMVSAQ